MSNGRKKFNYFTQQIQRSGKNFLQTKNALTLQRDAIRVFRDMARGNVDVREYEEYFLDSQFMESCLISANQKYSLHFISFTGVNKLIHDMQSSNQPVDDMTLAVLDYHLNASKAYNLIINGLEATKFYQTIEHLVPVVNQLRSFRNYI